MRCPDRRGMGLVLMLVLAALLVSAILLMSRMAVFRGEVRSSGRDRGREQALEVARSALAEARARIMVEAARPGTAAFQAFRTASQPELRVETPMAAQLAQGSVVGPVTTARLVARRALDLTEYEVAGLVRLEARVAYGPDPARTLSVSMDHEFKVVNLAPPRPFGKMALSVATPTAFLGPDPNARLMLSAQALTNLAAMARDAASKLSEKRGLAAALVGEVEALADKLAQLAPARDGALPAGFAWFGEARDAGHDLQLYVPLERARQGLELVGLNLTSRLAPHLARLVESETAFDAASKKLHQALKATNLLALIDHARLEEPARGFATAAGALAQAHRTVLERIAAYQREVVLVSGDVARQWLEGYWSRLGDACWQRRTFYDVDAGVALASLPSVDGVFRLQGPLDLSGAQVDGRRVLIASGPTRLSGLKRAAGAAGTGLVTVIAHGDVELSGEVDASVLVMPAKGRRSVAVRLAAGTVIRGVLALGPGVQVPELGGRIEVDPLVDSGGFGAPLLEDRYRVALSPEALAQGVLDS